MRWLDDLSQDVRYGFRLIRKNPVLSLATILTLALGIGLDTGVFTLIDGVLFRARVEHDPQSFVQVSPEYSGDTAPSGGLPYVSLQDYLAFRAAARSLHDLAAWTPARATLTEAGTGSGTSHVALVVSCNFFSVIGPERPLLGRVFRSDECATAGAAPVVVIGEEIWRARYAADPHILGSTITLNQHAFTVVGVMPAGYAGQLRGPIWVPYTMQASLFAGRDLIGDAGTPWLVMIGRLRAGQSRTAAIAELSVIAAQQDLLVPGRRTTIRLGNGALIDLPEMRAVAFWVVPLIMGALSLVLLLACGNVTMLLLSQAAARRHEIAVRISLGATRARLLRMLLTESLMFAVAALAPASWLAYKVPVIVRAIVPTMPYYPFRFDGAVWAYIGGIALLAAAIAAVAPAFESLRRDVSPSLHGADASDRITARWRTCDVLVAAQVGMSLTLMAGAAVFVRAEYRMMNAPPGYESDHVLFVAPRLAVPPYTQQSAGSFHQALRERLVAIPGVRSVAYASAPPFASEELPGARDTIRVSSRGGAVAVSASRNAVSPEFFSALGIPLVRGRVFQSGESAGRVPPVVISESLSRTLWPNGDSVGAFIEIGSGPAAEVVGVAADIRAVSARAGGNHVLYQPRPPDAIDDAILVRFDGESARIETAVRQAIASLNPDAVREPRTLTAIRNELASRFLRVVGMALFLGVVAATLAVIGIYGVVGFSVSRRIREMGIRAALGATRMQVMRLVIASGLKPIAAGLAIGIVMALVAAQALIQLFSNAPVPLDARDPIAYAVVTLLLVVAAVSAMFGPARRAAAADPIAALRHD
jgi:putative ABC transport system permease protein